MKDKFLIIYNIKIKLLNVLFYIIIVILNFNCAGCPYSFTGSSVPEHLKTISISLFDDQSNFGEPGLRERLTKSITEKFNNDNTLTVTGKNAANSILEGVILRISDKPISLTGDQVNRKKIEVTVKATFTDMVKKKKVWEKEFSNWGEYSSDAGAFAQRSEGLKTALEKIAEDILLQTVSGW